MKHAIVFVAACVGVCPALAAADRDRDTVRDTVRNTVVAGRLTTEVVPCASLCTESDWHGQLDGMSSFVLIWLEDLEIPDANFSRFHGDLVLSTAHGDLIGQDTGVWNLDTGAYVDVYIVTSGTEAYAGATGVILLFGTLDPVTGRGDSRYQGVVTTRHRR